MKILITCKGNGKSGSTQIRGAQLAEAIGAAFKPSATLADMRAHDVVVLVKRPTRQLVDDMRASGCRVIWDMVDSWPQPIGNQWAAGMMREWLFNTAQDIQPDGIICATRAMQRDVEDWPDVARPLVTTIYHHARPAYLAMPPRSADRVRSVGYEGGRNYLGQFETVIREECLRRGWVFNTESIADVDVALCLRDVSGYGPRALKSNVKLANAQARGIPALCSPEAGYQETSTGGVLWIDKPSDVVAAFSALSDTAHYAKVRDALDRPPTIEQCAEQYRVFLDRVVSL